MTDDAIAYSLFAEDAEAGLCCAVRQDLPVPAFVETWAFRGIIAQSHEAPPGFRPRAAHAATELTGFYLFHNLREPVRQALPVGQACAVE